MRSAGNTSVSLMHGTYPAILGDEQEFLQVMQAVKMALREPNVEPPDEFLMDFGNRFT